MQSHDSKFTQRRVPSGRLHQLASDSKPIRNCWSRLSRGLVPAAARTALPWRKEIHERRLRLGIGEKCEIMTWLWVTNRYPTWNPGKWKPGLKSAVPWWFNFDSCPHSKMQNTVCVCVCQLTDSFAASPVLDAALQERGPTLSLQTPRLRSHSDRPKTERFSLQTCHALSNEAGTWGWYCGCSVRR